MMRRWVLNIAMLIICHHTEVLAADDPATFWEDEFFTSGTIVSKECSKIYGGGDPKSTSYSAAVFTCAMMVCGHFRYIDRPECNWFRKVAHTNDFAADFQDIKNYLALMDLNEAKVKASNFAKKTPFQARQIFAGIKASLMQSYARDIREKNDPAYIKNSLLSPALHANNYYFVTKHLNAYCSQIEGVASYCKPVLGATPDDLLADRLTLSATIYNPDTQKALRQYPINAINPTPIPMMSPSKIFLSPAAAMQGVYGLTQSGKEHLKSKYLMQMIISINQEVVRRMYSERLPAKASLDDELPPGVTRADLFASARGIIESEASRRLYDPRWYDEMSRLDASGVLREIISMQSLQSYLDFEIDKRAEGLLALTAQDMVFIYKELDEAVSASVNQGVEVKQKLEDIGSAIRGVIP